MSPTFRLIAITDRWVADPIEPLTSLLAGLPRGALAVLLRDRDLAPEARRALGHQLRALTSCFGAPLLVAGDVAVAEELGADGLHLRDGEPLPETELLVGQSCHGRLCSADYVTLSPVRPSPGKGAALGWDAFGRAAQRPGVFALGGLGPGDAAEAVQAGAHGIAGIRSFLVRPDLRRWAEAAERLGFSDATR